MTISPFSLSHEWVLHWTRIPSHFKPSNRVNGESPKEQSALTALASVGVIGGEQLSQLFSLDKKRLKRMVMENKLVRHEIRMNNRAIPIYTLGINGAMIVGVNGYEHNYWVEYKVEDVLKRLLFFQLYHFFPNTEVVPTVDPFISSFTRNNSPMYVYVARGDTNDLLMFLKWNDFNERLFIVTESLSHLKMLKLNLKNIKVRVALDEELLSLEGGDVRQRFYYLNENGEWLKEA